MADFGREPLPQSWFERHPVRVAFDLIGCYLVVDRDDEKVVARIVETEAYGGDEDLASHATMYRVGRDTLTHSAGRLYMQLTYGIHTMTNIVSHEPGNLGAVLLRAAEDPVVGDEVARARMNGRSTSLLGGPGNLSRGMGTRLDDTLKPLTPETGIYFVPGDEAVPVSAGLRIGISRAVDARWRFFMTGSRHVSRHRRGEPVTPDMLEAIIHDLSPTPADDDN